MKIHFKDENSFTVIDLEENELDNEEKVQFYLKNLATRLRKIYHYVFLGSYQLQIYRHPGIMILDFENIGQHGKIDFDVTVFLNNVILYEFDDNFPFLGDKIFYLGKYYVEIDTVIDRVDIFEFGDILYGERVKEILNNGIYLPKKKTNFH